MQFNILPKPRHNLLCIYIDLNLVVLVVSVKAHQLITQ